MLSDFVVAESDQAQAIGEAERPADHWPTVEGWKGIEAIKLTTLYCAITGEPYSQDIMRSFTLVGGDKMAGPWVFQFPQEVIDVLDTLEESQFPDVALKWTKADEMAGWNTQDAEDLLEELVAQAQSAKSTGRALFLWFSM